MQLLLLLLRDKLTDYHADMFTATPNKQHEQRRAIVARRQTGR